MHDSSKRIHLIEPRWLQEKHLSHTVHQQRPDIFTELKKQCKGYLKARGARGDNLQQQVHDASEHGKIETDRVMVLKEITDFICNENECSLKNAEVEETDHFTHFKHHKRVRRRSLTHKETKILSQEPLPSEKDLENDQKQCLKKAKYYLGLLGEWTSESKEIICSHCM
mmetsp:Transcript_9604/g.35602  ORF Transcript_9604/g.35602 Transcript_9604/m.35602 type:complete len:169 (+) Transcript_9604:2198-2704(+)